MGKLLTLSAQDLLVLLLAVLIVFGPAAIRLLATLIAFRTSGRLGRAACILERLIREAEQRRARRQTNGQPRRRNWKKGRARPAQRSTGTDGTN